jgi:hypothetical protein
MERQRPSAAVYVRGYAMSKQLETAAAVYVGGYTMSKKSETAAAAATHPKVKREPHST